MGTDYWLGVKTGENEFTGIALGKESSLAAPFWAIDPPKDRKEYVSEVWDKDPHRWHYDPLERERLKAHAWLFCAANAVWDWLEQQPAGEWVVFNGNDGDWTSNAETHARYPDMPYLRVVGEVWSDGTVRKVG